MMSDIRGSVFSELNSGSAITANRRWVQRLFVSALTRKLGSYSDSRSYAAAELKSDLVLVNGSLGRTKDSVSLAHLEDLKKQIEFALANPDKMGSAGGGTSRILGINFKPWCAVGMPKIDWNKIINGD